MEIKDRRTPSAGTVAKKHGISMSRLGKQLAIGAKIEREHTHSAAKAREIARDHLAEIPDYYSRLKKMEREAGVKESYDGDPFERKHKENRRRWKKEKKQEIRRFKRETYRPDMKEAYVDPLEAMHNATRARILQGAKEGKYWLLRAEERDELINKILETVTTGSIGGYSKPLGVDARDITMGGRNKWIEKEKRFALSKLLNRSVSAPSP